MKDHLKTTTSRNERLRVNRSRLLSSDRKFAQVVNSLDPAWRLLETRKLSGGISAEMTAIKYGDGKSVSTVVVRRHSEKSFEENPNIAHYEFEILKHMCQAGLCVPHPYHLDDTGKIFKRPYVVLGLLDGEAVFNPEDKLDFGRKLAYMLLSIHEIEGSADLMQDQKTRLEKEIYKPKSKLDESIEEPLIRARLKELWPMVKANESKVLHGDFWPGNVLFLDGEISGVIDWEDCEFGDPLLELAITRYDLLCMCGQECMDVFTDTYLSKSGIDSTYLPVYELIAALRPAGKISEWARGWHDLGRADINHDIMLECHKKFRQNALASLLR